MLVVSETITPVPETTDHTDVLNVNTPRNAAQLIPKVRIPFTSLTNGNDLVPVGIFSHTSILGGYRHSLARLI